MGWRTMQKQDIGELAAPPKKLCCWGILRSRHSRACLLNGHVGRWRRTHPTSHEDKTPLLWPRRGTVRPSRPSHSVEVRERDAHTHTREDNVDLRERTHSD